MNPTTDPKIESFLTNIIGCPFQLLDIAIEKIDVKSWRQLSRLAENNPDYVAGITQTIQAGAYVPPIIASRHGKGAFVALDGIHRVLAAQSARREHVSAYVIDVDDDMAELIASCANVCLNGQGLTEEERRQHFLMAARRHSSDLLQVNLRDRLLKRTMLLLAISMATGSKWIDVEVLRSRVERLGLKMPPVDDQRHATGRRTDAWLLAVARFTDEELVKFWPNLTAAPANVVQRASRELDKCTSTKQRAEKADNLLMRLNPTIRIMSQTQADLDRRAATQVRSHGAGLLKIAPRFRQLAEKYEDVRATLDALRSALSEIQDVPQEHVAQTQ